MKNSTIKINKFTQKIKSDADKKRKLAEEEMQAYRTAELSKAKAIYEDEAEKYKKRRIEKGENEISSEISTLHLKARCELVSRRSEIVDDVIKSAGDELKKFTKTEEYIPFLEKCAKNLSSQLQSNKIILYVKKADLIHSEIIKTAFGKYCTVLSDEGIKIGGIRGYDAILYKLVDETLDEKLSIQREYFLKKSNLKISIR